MDSQWIENVSLLISNVSLENCIFNGGLATVTKYCFAWNIATIYICCPMPTSRDICSWAGRWSWPAQPPDTPAAARAMTTFPPHIAHLLGIKYFSMILLNKRYCSKLSWPFRHVTNLLYTYIYHIYGILGKEKWRPLRNVTNFLCLNVDFIYAILQK